jgi:A/G-specific adenine glycosylase
LLQWFDRHHRSLPWRIDRDPYRVWISEIMLQQTRVAAVLDHYARFLKRFPDVQSLAKARPATVLAAWSGLGYYRRARMMHAAARQIAGQRKGRFPVTAAEWLTLPGIGRYTAAAIASICFDQPCAVVDGNVERVMERLLGARPDDIWAWAGRLLSRRQPGDFNQAMMELGALVCIPRTPLCGECPAGRWCASKCAPPAASVPASRRQEVAAYGLFTQNDRVRLSQRGPKETVMPGMWELPAVAVPHLPSPAGKRVSRSTLHVYRLDTKKPSATLSNNSGEFTGESFTLRHAIMDTDYLVTVLPMPMPADCPGEWFSASRAARLPLTGLARKILKRAQII